MVSEDGWPPPNTVRVRRIRDRVRVRVRVSMRVRSSVFRNESQSGIR